MELGGLRILKTNIRGKHLKLTAPIKDYVIRKMAKLDKHFRNSDEIEATVLFRISGMDQIVEVTIPSKNIIVRAESRAKDLYSAIDLVIDKLDRQLRKNKSKMRKIYSQRDDQGINLEVEPEEEENLATIVKRKRLEIKPMGEEEAVLQMELLNHDFFVFDNVNTDTMCVLYKRKDGNYGIIETN
jgi:putative sigma-54 modulation protein